MTERSPNLLLAIGAKPANGIQADKIIQWYGGQLTIMASGAFNGATIDILASTVFPSSGKMSDFDQSTFFNVTTINAPGRFPLGNVNPCALVVKVNNSADNTRIRATVA